MSRPRRWHPHRRPPSAGSPPSASGADGYTLVELAVVMFVAAMLMVLFVPMIGAAGRASATVSALQRASAAGRTALQSIATQVGSASEVCLLDTTGSAPAASTACPSSTTSEGAQVLTDAYGSEHWVQWWYEQPPADSPAGTPGQLMEQTWPDGQSPPQPTVTVVAGATVATGATTCSIAPGPGGLFSLSGGASSRQGLTISLEVTCGSGPNASTVSMQSTATALDTPT